MAKIVEKQDFLAIGGLILRNTPNHSNSRFLWLDPCSKELRWASGLAPSHDFKRVALSHIESISRIAHHEHCGFQIDTRNHNIKFWAFSLEEREHWVKSLLYVMRKDSGQEGASKSCSPHTDENEGATSPEVLRKRALPSFILAEANGEGCSRELFKKSVEGGVLAAVCEVVANYTDNKILRIEDLPRAVEECIQQQEDCIQGIQEEIDNVESTAETEDLKTQIQELQRRIAALPRNSLKHENKINTLNAHRMEYQAEKTRTDELSLQLEQLYHQKDKVLKQCRVYRTELDFLNAHNYHLTQQLDKTQLLNKKQKFSELLKGVHAMVRKRGGEFVPRLVMVAPEMDRLVIRPSEGMSPDREEVGFGNVTCFAVHKNTDLKDHRSMSIHSPQSPLVLAVPTAAAPLL